MPPNSLSQPHTENSGLLTVLIGDGRPLLAFTGLALILSGGFALFLALSGQFLPHDIQFLGMSAEQLCAWQECRVARFMIHDRAAFGGALIAIGILYVWLAEFPLRAKQEWAWWLFVVSGACGFASFLAYLGYGYLDTWHGIATLFLLPLFCAGVVITARRVVTLTTLRELFLPYRAYPFWSRYTLGRALLLGTTVGMMGAGLTIVTVGTSIVFVPQDLEFLKLAPNNLNQINAHLIPLIAHDRAGFGGGILTTGITAFFALWCAKPSRHLWQALALAGISGFGSAILIHFWVGYTDLIHLAPALVGATTFTLGIILCAKPMLYANENRHV